MVCPRIIHLIYFPWGKDQKLLADCHAFDHKPYENMARYAQGFDVRLWTLDRVQLWCEKCFPDTWRILRNAPRPMMMVDYLRWLVVHEFGGIYWQYDLNPLVPMDQFLPQKCKAVRLFTESVQTPEYCQLMAFEPIRNGEPEEAIRVANQVFSAVPGHRFVKATMDLIVHRLQSSEFKKDYDLLYISANAAVSCSYDRFGKSDEDVELLSRERTRSMVKIQFKGTWRTDANKSGYPPKRVEMEVGGRGMKIKNIIKSLPGAARIYHRTFRKHPHEVAIPYKGQKGIISDEIIDGLVLWAKEKNVASILEYPIRDISRFREVSLSAFKLYCATLSRNISGGYPHFNPMYMKWPEVDLVVCFDYFEFLPNADIDRVLKTLVNSSCRYLMVGHYDALNNNWDTALGDYRPVNWSLSPWSLGEPVWTTAWPNTDGRPDRVAAIWALT